jgi:hypothetical protein
MSGWTIFLLIVALIYWVLRGGFKRLKEAKQRGDIISYQAGSQERNWALALAHPMAYHAMQGGFASDLHGADEALARQLRPMILHHLGLRTDLSDEQVRLQLPDALRQRWFMLDLQRLQRSDDVRAAMAFACARVTFLCAAPGCWNGRTKPCIGISLSSTPSAPSNASTAGLLSARPMPRAARNGWHKAAAMCWARPSRPKKWRNG